MKKENGNSKTGAAEWTYHIPHPGSLHSGVRLPGAVQSDWWLEICGAPCVELNYWAGLLHSVKLTEEVLPRIFVGRTHLEGKKTLALYCGKRHSLDKDQKLPRIMQKEIDKCRDLLLVAPAGKRKIIRSHRSVLGEGIAVSIHLSSWNSCHVILHEIVSVLFHKT